MNKRTKVDPAGDKLAVLDHIAEIIQAGKTISLVSQGTLLNGSESLHPARILTKRMLVWILTIL